MALAKQRRTNDQITALDLKRSQSSGEGSYINRSPLTAIGVLFKICAGGCGIWERRLLILWVMITEELEFGEGFT